jgi:membrane associated rhomboid family serine protease
VIPIPLRALTPIRSRPVITYSLIAANLAVFLYQVQLRQSPGAFDEFMFRWGFIPYFFTQEPHFHSFDTPLTSMFMHGSWMHLISNMWFLHIFGGSVEDALGKGRFTAFYLLCGLCAALAQLAIDPASRIPMVGASGAIAGVLGAYFRLFPNARLVTLIPLLFFFVRELPAVFFIIVWFLLQLLSGIGSLGAVDGGSGGVAFFAHIGGFVAGMWCVTLFVRQRNPSAGFRKPGTPSRHYESWRDDS